MVEVLKAALVNPGLCSSGLVDGCIVIQKQNSLLQLPSAFVIDDSAQLSNQISIVLSCDCRASGQVIYQNDSHAVPKNRRHDLPSGWLESPCVSIAWTLVWSLIPMLNPGFLSSLQLLLKAAELRENRAQQL